MALLVFSILLITLVINSMGLVRPTEAITEAGPSGFGYDASSACSKPYSRTGRARLENLPCDFSRENWCTIAGNAYPWQAVRRFVQENQGLMRRMYGDEKHISVLKTELEKNDVELELEEEQNHLHSEEPNSIFRQFQFDVEYEYEGGSSLEARRKLARSLNSGTSSKFEKPEDHPLHPNETPSGGSGASISTTIFPSTLSQDSTGMSTAATSSTVKSHRTKMSPIASPETTPSTGSLSTTVSPSISSAADSLANIRKTQNLSINEIPGQIDRFDSNADELTEIPETTLSAANQELGPNVAAPTADSIFGQGLGFQQPEQIEDLEEPEEHEEPEESEEFEGPQESDEPETSESQHKQHQQQFRPRPEYRPAEVTKPDTTASPEAQLFQDVAAKDKQEVPLLKVRGINACPVKEEVVAPFWANNTRGEVLALLNLYPFEQYVHWEKCTHENKQMYCREGCRCEQQYRLHRLLAYDPNNECRGIFSDWFKFPSCCICRCYDLPIEFRVTSRSPRRLVRREKIKVRAPQRHRASRQRQN